MKPALITVGLIALAALLGPFLLPYNHASIDWNSVRVGLCRRVRGLRALSFCRMARAGGVSVSRG